MSSTSPSSGSGASDSGHTIGPYVLTREIGKGSFAVVFQAKLRSPESKEAKASGSTTLASKVAIKIVTRRKLTQKLLENLEGEISILRTVRHVNIVELINCFKTSSHIYLVMQYCRMGDLSNYIRTRRRGTPKDNERHIDHREVEADAIYPHPRDGGLNSQVARSFLSQLAAALQFMRARNIVHRDIKPQNLLLQEPESDLVAAGHPALIPQVKVADFGFARHLESASLAETLCGSPLYMAPEILRYEKYDAKADLWSVGAVLYEMCVGKPPFRAANYVELLKRIEKGEDRIRFPDDRTEDSYRREEMRLQEEGRDVEEVIRPHTVDEDMKSLIRALLKRKPVERMTFESFFSCDIVEEGRLRSVKALQSSSSSLSNSATPVATRVAPSIPKQAKEPGSSAPTKAPQGVDAETQQTTIVRSYFKPKYVVGGKRAPRAPRREDRVATSAQEQQSEAGEASSLEDNVLETPGSSVTHLPMTPGPPVETPKKAAQISPTMAAATVTPSTRPQRAKTEDEDKGYVMVEKRNVEVNALADGIAEVNLAKTANEQRGGAWGALAVVRRPSRLGRLASGLGAGVGFAGLSPPSPSSPSLQAAIVHRTVQTSPPAAPSPRLACTPPNAPFAIPLGARRPSFNRRTSHNNDTGLPRFSIPSPNNQVALIASSAPTTATTGGGSPVSYTTPTQGIGMPSPSSSALSRAISMASIRLFGVPTGMSLRSSNVRRSLRLGLGAGNFLSTSPVNALEYHGSDPAEQNLLNLLHDYGQKSFVLSEFADAKLSLFYSEGPHQGNYDEAGRHVGSSGSTSSSVYAAEGRKAVPPSQSAATMSLSSEVVAAEALVLYVKSLSFLQRGIDATKDYIEARTVRYSNPYQASVEVNDAVQWLRAKFNDGYERAEFARSKATSEEMPDSAQHADKMIFDKALEIARGAALEELGSNRDVSDQSWSADKCLLAYETASSMLMALLDPGEDGMELSDASTGTIERFVKSIQKRMASLQQRYEGPSLPV